jgi:hypothetical protein
MWIEAMDGNQLYPMFGYMGAVKIMSRRYEDIWKLGNVPGHVCVTIEMEAVRFSDNIFS